MLKGKIFTFELIKECVIIIYKKYIYFYLGTRSSEIANTTILCGIQILSSYFYLQRIFYPPGRNFLLHECQF